MTYPAEDERILIPNIVTASGEQSDQRSPTGRETRQWHHVALLFTDLSRSSALANRLDAEQMADLLDQFREACRRVVHAHGGQVARIQGDGMLAIFGYPAKSERTVLRAVEAAFDLNAAVRGVAVPDLPASLRTLTVHSGVHAGLVLLTEGDIERGRIDVVGEVPNSAERLSKAAGPGEVCVSAATLGPERAHYVIAEDVAVPTTPGDPDLAAYRLTARRSTDIGPSRMRAVGRPSRFAGRDEALQALLTFSTRDETAPSRCATVSGGAGLGKSRLLSELQHLLRTHGSRPLHGYCDPEFGGESLQPFMQVLRALSTPDNGGQAVEGADLPRVTGPDYAFNLLLQRALGSAEHALQEGRAAAVVSAIAAAATAHAGGLILILDDWQWADDASRWVLSGLLEQQCRLRIVLASREPDVHRLSTTGAPSVELHPLAIDAAANTVLDLLPGADPILVRDIHARAGGVPLYVEELCHAARAGRMLTALPGRAGSTAWLDLLVEARLARLPLDCVEMVRRCSVLGAGFPVWLMQELTGVGPADPVFEVAAAADFLSLHADGKVHFKHQLTRDAVYATIGRKQRREWHANAYRLLVSRTDEGDSDAVESLALHSAGAGMHVEHAQLAEHAGDKAMAVFALDRARAHYFSAQRSLEPLEAGPNPGAVAWCRIAAKLGMISVFDPLGLAEGIGMFERAVVLAGALDDEVALARSEYWLGYVSYAKGYARLAVQHCRRASQLARRAGDSRLSVQVEATLGQALMSACRYDEALLLLDAAVQGKRANVRQGSSVAIGSAYALSCKGAVLGDRGQVEAAKACFSQARDLLGTTGHPVACSVLGWIAAVCLWHGEWDEASRVAREGERIAERAGTRHLLAMCRALDGYAHWRMGAGRSAFEQVYEATQWIEDRQGAFVASLNYGWLLDMAAEQGMALADVSSWASSLDARARHGDRLGEAMGRRALATMAIREGSPKLARTLLDRAERVAAMRGSTHEHAANAVCRQRWFGVITETGPSSAPAI